MLGPLSRIMIFSGDAMKCAAFFRDHFGLAPVGEWSAEWAELDGGGCRLAFHQAYGEEGRITTPTGSPRNPHKIVFTVPDVEKARTSLIDRGVEMGPLQRFEELGNLILCDGADPEGHVFQICNR